ncbi:MAG: hypothetical protein ABEI54_01305 [Candidatus Bipolaricaulia bacterium]
MEEKSKILVISLAIVLLALPFVTAQGAAKDSTSGSIFNFGTDAKSLAMGGAFVAVADNYSATYWNPAGLTQFSGVQLGGMNLQPYGIGGLNFSFGGGAVTIQDFAFGASYGQLSASLSDQLGYPGTDYESYSETMIGGTFAYGIDFANFGVNVKSYQFSGQSGFGFDLGTLMTFDGISLGVAASDIGGVSLSENSTIKPTYRLGVAAELLSRAVVSAEVDIQGSSPLMKAGFEVLPIPQFGLRGGVQVPSTGGPSFTVGAGINLAGLTVDIAWLQNNTEFAGRSNAGDTLVLSAGFKFGAFGESA